MELYAGRHQKSMRKYSISMYVSLMQNPLPSELRHRVILERDHKDVQKRGGCTIYSREDMRIVGAISDDTKIVPNAKEQTLHLSGIRRICKNNGLA